MSDDVRRRIGGPLGTAIVVAVVVSGACAACGRGRAEAPPAHLEAMPPPPSLMFINLANDGGFNHVAVASLASPAGAAYVTPLSCERVYFASGRGLCLSVTDEGTIGPDGPVASRWAEVFDASFTIRRRIKLAGAPSRVRVSPDGRYAAATVFDSGHSYADHRFSTRTTIFNLETADVAIDDLETVETRRDGAVFSAKDFNFWGVTFARDGQTFYATLDTGGTSYLVRGRIDERVMHVVHAGVECPSLSPDNTRIAFKRRVGSTSRGWWQIALLDLASMKESLLAGETRSVDDQVEWLDDERVAYHITGEGTPADLWAIRVDGTGAPERIRRSAYSPAVLR
jgi:hypothetical protein